MKLVTVLVNGPAELDVALAIANWLVGKYDEMVEVVGDVTDGEMGMQIIGPEGQNHIGDDDG